MATKRYRVSDAAGPWVAGRKVAPGDHLELTDDQAAYELARGQIEVPAGGRAETAARTMHIASAPKRRGRG